ncbi:MAG: GNAT family N-acetyltransferase [Acidiferrobacter sp.]
MDGVKRPTLRVDFAQTPADINEAQQLRYQIFARELGAAIGDAVHELDSDRFDPYCQHLVIRDDCDDGRIVACSRILTAEAAANCGGFYSQLEFDLAPILALPGRVIEIGRTCVHSDHRQGPAIALLLSGVVRFMEDYNCDYLIGCGSIPLAPNRDQALQTIATLLHLYGSPPALRVRPHCPLPAMDPDRTTGSDNGAPALLRAYMRLGAYVCGAPCFDPDFDVADVLVLLMRSRFDGRYLERLLGRSLKQQVA